MLQDDIIDYSEDETISMAHRFETSFFNGDLTEEIFMKMPYGHKRIHGEEKYKWKVIKLNNSDQFLIIGS
jgi:CRISPR/Cas system-associated endoribonuclease Cas2